METKRVTLTELADHLEKGECIHEYFDISDFNLGELNQKKILNCGTSGCAIGEMPLLDKQWTFFQNGQLLFGGTQVGPSTIADYFEIEFRGAYHLFYPLSQDVNKYGGTTLDYDATKAEVIHNIREFVRITGKN